MSNEPISPETIEWLESKVQYWMGVVRGHERELDIITKFLYTSSYDED